MDLSPPQPPRPKRPPAKWIVLLLVWSIGLLVWILYVVAIGYLALKFLG
jgi:hypothetical protein